MNLRKTIIPLGLLALTSLYNVSSSQAADNFKDKPYLGWSSWSLQATKYPGYGGEISEQTWLSAQHIKEQSDAMAARLQAHGYTYINIDSGWGNGWDEFGRPTANAQRFPGGIREVADYVHAKGQKLGIYYIPGISDDLLTLNPPIKGTAYHIRDIVFSPRRHANGWGGGNAIDFSKPGAQEYIQSIADQFAAWGIDFLKFDGITPGSDQRDPTIDARPDVAAWDRALKKTGRPIWLTLSWNLDLFDNAFWRQNSNAIRTGSDVESYDDKLTHWPQIKWRFGAVRRSWMLAGRGKGWNDLDSLLIGNAEMSGLTPDERRTTMTLWAIHCSPLYSGDDLTKLDPLGLELLTNDEVIAVQQGGIVASPVNSDLQKQIWTINEGKGKRVVVLFNLGDEAQTLAVSWKELAMGGLWNVRDLWTHQDLGKEKEEFSAVLAPHSCRLLRLTATR
ncbi:alpha-galactosidase A [Abditibacteriota bacterium]|nr:alpha-galactosidase A [Abditibacteriota bacterium]